ncbi:MAG: FAD-binding protein [Clostridiales Family XIII bacterium]|nr:FAD-binding protein [Clostridiales Family XIII bacterium]
MSTKIERLRTDVLIVGGGIAGSMAAIRAKEEGVDVIVLEKANTWRSGNAGGGVDHLQSYIPALHERVGYTKNDMKYEEGRNGLMHLGLGRPQITDRFVETSAERILALEKYGINFRHDNNPIPGGFRAAVQFHSVPTSFHMDGRDIKVKLTEAMIASGVNIINRAQVVELLKNGDKVTGAIAISSRENKIYAVSAKTTILTTSGGFHRLEQRRNNNNRHNENVSASNYGAGTVLAINAGAEVINLEFSLISGSPITVYLNYGWMGGAPSGTWWPAGRLIDDAGNVVLDRQEEFSLDDPDYVQKYEAQTKKLKKQRASLAKYINEGRQLYLDMSEASDDELFKIRRGLTHEGKLWLLSQHLNDWGIDLKKVRVPVKLYEGVSVAEKSHTVGVFGVLVNEKLESTVENLYAAGSEMGGAGCIAAGAAVVYGFEGGLQAAHKAKTIADFPDVNETQVQDLLKKYRAIYGNRAGSGWKEVEFHVQGIVNVFGRPPFTDRKTADALYLLNQLKDKVAFRAEDAYETAKSFEVITLIETAIAVFTAINERKESVGPFQRISNGTEKSDFGQEKSLPEIIGLYKENGQYVFNRHQGEIKERAQEGPCANAGA